MTTLSTWPFGSLRPLSYSLLVIDCPWDFENYSAKGTKKGADPHYDVMSLDAIKALPVARLAQGDCLLLAWATGAMLPKCIDTVKAWGFEYKTELIWRKLWPSGKPRMGTGYRARSFHEPVILATLGRPKHKPLRSLFDGTSREHSRKPDEFFAMVEQCCPNLMSRAELFSRENRPGWESWGDQQDRFTSSKFNQSVNLRERRKSLNGAPSHADLFAHPPRPAPASDEATPAAPRAKNSHGPRKPRIVRSTGAPFFGGQA